MKMWEGNSKQLSALLWVARVSRAGECVSHSRTFRVAIVRLSDHRPRKSSLRRDASTSTRDARATQPVIAPLDLASADTEQVNARSRNLEKLSPREFVELFGCDILVMH